MRSKRKVDVEKIIVKYVDGTEKEIDKGVILTLKEQGEEARITMEFASISGTEFGIIAYGFLQACHEIDVLDD